MAAAGGKRGMPACYVRPMLRRVEVVRLAIWRQDHRRYTSPHDALIVAGHAIASLEGMRLRGRPRHPGLDIMTAEEFLVHARLDLTVDDTIEIVHEVNRSRAGESPFVMTDVRAGELLELQREERTGLGITTMEAADEPTEERRARKAEEKRDRDRERQIARRRQAGIGPRPAQTTEMERPWEALGISRRTWFRRQKTTGSDVGTFASRTSVGGTAASRTSLLKGERRSSATSSAGAALDGAEGGRQTARPSLHPAMPEPRRPNGDTQAASVVIRLIGKGDATEGARIAATIAPDKIRRWISSVTEGALSGDARMELEMECLSKRNELRRAS